MRSQILGKTDITVSALTFGCGNVGGLMVRGDPREQREAVARALDAGVRYFDTAPLYGDGLSEQTLGRVLPPTERRAAIGTKVRLTTAGIVAAGGPAAAIRAALDASLRRLGRDSVDLYQLHNAVDDAGTGEVLPVDRILDDVVPAFQAVQRAGKARHLGFTALGDADAIERLAASGAFAVAQVPYSLLNPSAARDALGGETARLLLGGRRAELGTIGIRVLAGGALGDSAMRHPLASPAVAPIGLGQGTGRDYAADTAAAVRYRSLVDAGAARSLPALAIRYALSERGLDTFAIGFSDLAQLQEALVAVEAGPLDDVVLDAIHALQPRSN